MVEPFAKTPFVNTNINNQTTGNPIRDSIFGFNNLGVSGTDIDQVDAGAFANLQKTPKPTTTDGIIKQAQTIADKAYGDSTAGDIDWGVASLLYFSKMAENASKPGATALGSAASAFTTPAAYIMQKDKEKQALEAKKGATVASLIPSLVTASKTTAKDPKAYTLKNDVAGVGKTGETVYYNATEFKNLPPAIKKSFTPYEKPPTTGNFTEYTAKIDIPDLGIKKGDSKLYTNAEFAKLGANKNAFSKYEKPEKETFKTYKITKPFTASNGISYNIGDEKILSNKIVKENTDNLQEVKVLSDKEKLKQDYDIYKPMSENYKNEDEVKGFVELNTQFQKVESSYQQAYVLERPQVADVSLIFAFMKMLDPRSVVREGEFTTAEKTGGAADYLVNQANKVFGGGALKPSQRESFYKQARDLLQRKADDLTQVNVGAEKAAKEFEVDFNLYKVEPKVPPAVKYIELPKNKDFSELSDIQLFNIANSGANNLLDDKELLNAIKLELDKRITKKSSNRNPNFPK
jgi:hypothetical protein